MRSVLSAVEQPARSGPAYPRDSRLKQGPQLHTHHFILRQAQCSFKSARPQLLATFPERAQRLTGRPQEKGGTHTPARRPARLPTSTPTKRRGSISTRSRPAPTSPARRRRWRRNWEVCWMRKKPAGGGVEGGGAPVGSWWRAGSCGCDEREVGSGCTGGKRSRCSTGLASRSQQACLPPPTADGGALLEQLLVHAAVLRRRPAGLVLRQRQRRREARAA